MKIVAIVQARMGSTRLPGKVMKPLLGEPMLARLLERLAHCERVDDIVVATTDDGSERPIVELMDALNVNIFRGSEDDVLARYYGAARRYNVDVVVRVTSDCPLIAPEVVDKCVEAFLASGGNVDYASNGFKRTYPRGLDTEVFGVGALEAAHHEATTPPEREHVTPFIWRQPQRFRLLDVVDAEDHSDLRWTVDTPEDFELVAKIYGALYPTNPAFSYRDVLRLLSEHPEWSDLNRHVEQKKVGS